MSILTRSIFYGLMVVSLPVMAAVSQEEANKLGTSLTPMGANPAANADGSIPAYTGKVLGVPAGVNYKGSGYHYPNPYPNEKPLVVLTKDNYLQHKEFLTDGHIALFNRYPDTYKMPIYPSKREVRYSDKVWENTKINATQAKLDADGDSVRGGFHGTWFPIPKQPLELLWNHRSAPFFGAMAGTLDYRAVYQNGDISPMQRFEERVKTDYDDRMTREKYTAEDQKIAGYILATILEPTRQKGSANLLHEYRLSQAGRLRDAWTYLPANRRVRRAPTIQFDFPDGPGGLRTVDDALLFNGSTVRYNWAYKGVVEKYIPYNNNKMDDPTVKYGDLLPKNHPNPEYMRYEKHRVHVLEATLKEGNRHVYAKRVMYLDEDSWNAVISDNFDAQGQLWRTNFRTMVNLYDLPGMGPRLEVFQDLQKGAYLVGNLINGLDGKGNRKLTGADVWPDSYFSPNNLRQIGK